MTPQDQLGSQGQQQQGPPQEQSPSLFGGGGAGERPAQQSAAKQLTMEMAQIHSSLKGFAKAHPEMSESVDKAIQALVSGMNKSISTMQTRESEGSQPAYA